MKNLVLFISVFVLIISGCKDDKPVRTTALYEFTVFQNYPEFLNGQIKSVNEQCFWAIEKEDDFIKGEPLSRADRDSLKWSSDFTLYFNEEGKLTRSDRYYTSDETRSTVIEIENGLIVKVTDIRGSTEYIYAITTFDTDNHWESVKQYRSGVDTLINSFTFVTNSDGYITEYKTFNSLGKNTRINYYDIDENNRTTALKVYFSPDSLLSTTKYLYNEKGFNTSVEFENSSGVTNNWKVEYSNYDDMDNWLTCTCTLKDGQKVILERKYEYY